MTTATLTRAATKTAAGYGFRSVARMEWLKLRSVRSTAWVLLVFAAGMIGLAIAGHGPSGLGHHVCPDPGVLRPD